MKIRITYIHKISPRPDQDTYVVDGAQEDLIDLDSVRKLLRRHDHTAPNTKVDRKEVDTEGNDVFVFFPRKDIWHSIIVREEP